MTVVYHQLVDDDGPKANARIHVELTWNRYVKRNATFGESFITHSEDTRSNSAGYWEMELIPGADLEPAGCLYRVTQRTLPGLKQEDTVFIEVPDDASPVALTDIIVPKPGWEN